jgi:uncharacterized membrane protein
MPPIDEVLHLVVRWAHLVAAGLLIGGASLVWWLAVRPPATDDSPGAAVSIEVAERYEWLSWGALAVLVMTGVASLGGLGGGIPSPGTGWGAAFGAKLLLVVALLAGSALRTMVLVRWRTDRDALPGRATFRNLYAGTAIGGAAVFALGAALAHG